MDHILGTYSTIIVAVDVTSKSTVKSLKGEGVRKAYNAGGVLMGLTPVFMSIFFYLSASFFLIASANYNFRGF